MKEQLIEAYKEMLINGEDNINAYNLARKVGASEEEFYKHFNSAEDVGRTIWADLGNEVFAKLNDSEAFQNYGAREKVLTFYFTFFEVALNYRTFIEVSVTQPKLLKTYKENFKQFISDIIQEGIAAEEIKERLSLSTYYPDVLWGLHLRLVSFWLNDSSESFVETDKAIEIYSKIPLEVMGHNLLDSMFETAKFNLDQLKSQNFDFKAPSFLADLKIFK